MPSEKSARSSERKRVINRRIRNSTRTMMTKAVSAVQRRQLEEADPAVTLAITALDSAASKGIIHRNNAARKKSRLMAKLNALKAS